MLNVKRTPFYFARQHKNLLNLLSDLRFLDGDSALLWVRLDDQGIESQRDSLMASLVSTTRSVTVAANAGYFVEQMSPCVLAAVLDTSTSEANFGALMAQLEVKIRYALGADVAARASIDLLRNEDATGTVGELVARMTDERCSGDANDRNPSIRTAA